MSHNSKKSVTFKCLICYISNVETFSSFYQAQSEKLFGYMIRLTGDYQLSCDIMQESFARYLEHYGPQTQNVSLLFTIARNAVWDNNRKRSHIKELEDDIKDGAIDPEQQLSVREEYRKVLAAMQQLDKTDRDILALTVSSDMTYRDIAAVTGISEANVKVKVHRTRIKLRKILKTGEE